MRRVEELKTFSTKTAIRQMPFSAELNMWQIREHVVDIREKCGDIQWAEDQLDDILGDDLAHEFRMQYSDLYTASDSFLDELSEYRETWTMDGEEKGESFFDEMVVASGGTNDLMWADEMGASDYTPLWGWIEDYAERMAVSRIKRLTKDKIIELVGDVLWILKNYWDIKLRYQLLAGIFDLVHEEACEELDAVKGVEAAWAAWNEQKSESAENELIMACIQLPQTVWLM